MNVACMVSALTGALNLSVTARPSACESHAVRGAGAIRTCVPTTVTSTFLSQEVPTQLATSILPVRPSARAASPFLGVFATSAASDAVGARAPARTPPGSWTTTRILWPPLAGSFTVCVTAADDDASGLGDTTAGGADGELVGGGEAPQAAARTAIPASATSARIDGLPLHAVIGR